MGNWQFLLLALVAFWSIINYVYAIKRDRFKERGVEVSPVTLIWRLKFPREKLSLSPKLKSGLKILFSILVLVSVGALVFALKIYFENLLGIFYAVSSGEASVSSGVETPIVPIIPGVTISLSELPFLLLALAIAIVVHEGCHALAAIVDDVPLKSWGFALLLFIPAAFVEPSEEEFSKQKLSVKARVYSAGPSANVVAAFTALAILVLTIPLIYSIEYGIVVLDVVEGGPAYRAGVKPNMTIIEVNGEPIGGELQYYNVLFNPQSIFNPLVEAIRELEGREGEIELKVKVWNNTGYQLLELKVHKLANESKIGVIIYPQVTMKSKYPLFSQLEPYYLKSMMWIFLVNLGLALINATPIIVTDGGRLLTEVMEKLFGEAGKSASLIVQSLIVVVLILNILASVI